MAEHPVKLIGRAPEGQFFKVFPPDDQAATEWRLIVGGHAFDFYDIKAALAAKSVGDAAFTAGRQTLQRELRDLLGARDKQA